MSIYFSHCHHCFPTHHRKIIHIYFAHVSLEIKIVNLSRWDFRRWLTKVNSQDISRLGVVRDPSHITKMHIRKKSLGPFSRNRPIVNIFKTLTRNFWFLVGFSQILCPTVIKNKIKSNFDQIASTTMGRKFEIFFFKIEFLSMFSTIFR